MRERAVAGIAGFVAVLAVLASSAVAVAPYAAAGAAFKVYDQPTQSYFDQKTCLIDLSRYDDYTQLTSVDMCGVLISFSSALDKRKVPRAWPFNRWGSAPDVERERPNVLYTGDAKTLTLSYDKGKDGIEGKKVVGVEAAPHEPGAHSIVANFADRNGTTIGTISRDVDPATGARLFAGKSMLDGVDTKTLTLSSDVGFAIARIRVTSGH